MTKRSNMIGVVLPEIAHSFFADVISGIEAVLDSAGYDLLLCHSRSDAARERAEIETLMGSRIDALIVAPVQPIREPQVFLDLQKRGVPFVLFDRFFPGYDFPSIRLDDFAAGKLAANYLMELGHRRIAHIAGPAISPGLLRKKGFLAALRRAEVPVDRELVIRSPFEMKAGRAAMEQLLQRKDAPTAIFCANDPLAIGAIYACRDAGIRVPEDVSIMGAGNIKGVFHPTPFLTTIDWPGVEQGRMAAEFVLASLAGGKAMPQPSHVFEPKMLPRHSTAPLRTKKRPGQAEAAAKRSS